MTELRAPQASGSAVKTQSALDDARGMSFIGVALALLIVAAVIWLVVSSHGGPGNDEAAAHGLPQTLSSQDHARQLQTLANMKLIARANDLFCVETGSYAARLADLEARGHSLAIDGWGNPYVYAAEAGTYTLTSLGSDGAPGPAPPARWSGSPYDPDLVMISGRFAQAPSEP